MIMFRFLICLAICFKLSLSLSWKRTDAVGARHFHKDRAKITLSSSSINYALFPGFIKVEEDYIKKQIKKLEEHTCIKATQVDSENCHHWQGCLRFYKDDEPKACRAKRDFLEVRLPKHCFEQFYILHGILHLLGFEHEHQRPDRDCYVKLHPSVVNNPHHKKIDDLDTSFPYDVKSVTHYRRDPYIRPADKIFDQNATFGSTDELSAVDVVAINYEYCQGPHYCELNPLRCEYFHCWVTCNNCSDRLIEQCSSCSTYQ